MTTFKFTPSKDPGVIEQISIRCEPEDCFTCTLNAIKLVEDCLCETAVVKHGTILHAIARNSVGIVGVVATIDLNNPDQPIKTAFTK